MLSCNEKEKIIVEVLNHDFATYSSNLKKDSTNILQLKITNNSKKKYYFNFAFDKLTKHEIGIPAGFCKIKIYDEKKQEVKYFPKFTHESIETLECDIRNLEKITYNANLKGYKTPLQYHFLDLELDINNFILYPNESLYFEFPFKINKIPDNKMENQRIYTNLKSNKKYFSLISFFSDSLNYKENLPRNILKSLEENNIEVFNGELIVQRKIPIKILE